MNGKLREFAKDSLFYAVGDWLSKIGSLILVPILSRIFLPSDYGIIEVLNTSYLFVLMVGSLNIDSGMQRFFYMREGKERNVLISSSMVLRLAFTSLLAVAAITLAQRTSQLAFGTSAYSDEIILLAVLLPIEDIYGQLMLLLRLSRKAVSFSAYNMSQVMMQPILTYLCVVSLQQNLKGVFIARLATILIVSPLLLMQQRRFITKRIRFQEAVNLMKFSLPGLPDSVQTTIINLLPGYFLLHFSTLTSVGLYSVADKIAKTIDMFKTSFNRAWSPFAFAHAGKEDEKYLYEKIFKLFAGGLFTLAFVLTVFSHEFISILTPPKYHAAAGLVGSICLYYALRALTLVFGTGLYSANRVAHTSYMTSIQLVVFVVGALLLVPSYGANGLILSLNVAVIAYFASYAMTVKKYFAFQFSSCRLLLLLLLALIGVGYVYQASQTVIGIVVVVNIIKKIVVVSLYILLGYFIILTRIERRSVKSGAKKLLAFCGLPLYAHNMNIEINDKDI